VERREDPRDAQGGWGFHLKSVVGIERIAVFLMDPFPLLAPTRWMVSGVVRDPAYIFSPHRLPQSPEVELAPAAGVTGEAFPAPGLHSALRHPEPRGASPDAAGGPERIRGATRGTGENGPVCEAEMNPGRHED